MLAVGWSIALANMRQFGNLTPTIERTHKTIKKTPMSQMFSGAL